MGQPRRSRTPAFGRRTPPDRQHVEKYRLSAVAPLTIEHVERRLHLPAWHADWDQGDYGACVGWNVSMMMSIVNEIQGRATGIRPYSHRYMPLWLWDRAKERDDWPDTNPGDNEGTSVRAACDVLRELGHVRILRGKARMPNPSEGIQNVNRWAVNVDEMRTAIANGIPVAIGVDWYRTMSRPTQVGTEYWIGQDLANLGALDGGHCVCVYGASDRREAFILHNSWGRLYGDRGRVWLPYATMQKLLDDNGEACVVFDR